MSKPNNVKVAIVSNFTIKGLKEELEKKCNSLVVSAQFYEAGYDQIRQEFMDAASNLKKFSPDITFCMINAEFLFKDEEFAIIADKEERREKIESIFEDFTGVVDHFLNNISGTLVVSNVKQTTYTPLGINEDKLEHSLKEWAALFNRKCKEKYLDMNRVRFFDLNAFFLKYGEYNVINPKLRYLGDIYIDPDYMPKLAEELMGYVKPFSSKNRKCIVLDLDNTLWGGIVGEDGFNNIKLDDKAPGNTFMEFQKYLLGLHKKGIILAICSKNNEEDAMKVIKEHPYMVLREEHFACIKINWDNKVNNIIEIAQEINIGLDSLVFIDDDPMNGAMVRENLPQVLVVDLPKDSALYVRTLKEISDFNTMQLTKEDFQKGQMYYQQRKRTELKIKMKDIDDFLKNLNLEVKIEPASDFTIPRISQLTKKTNQFNLTTKRYTEEDIRSFVNQSNFKVFSVGVKDKFGDNGLTGVLILEMRKDEYIIDTLLLSCRIIGRNVEKVLLKYAVDVAKEEGVKKLVGLFTPSEKNVQVKRFYPDHGFTVIDEEHFELTDFDKVKKIEYIRVYG
ncbi:MAG: HAD-IIIC family phosphatase [Nanoarchaeota archaeon]